MTPRLLPVCALLLLSTACVSSGTHEDLKKKYDGAQADLQERGQRIGTLEESLSAAQAHVAQLEGELAAAREQIAQLEEAGAQNEAELARARGEEARLSEELASLMKDRSRLRESTEQLREALQDLSRRKAEAERRVAEFRSLLARFKNLIDAGKLQVKIVDGRMVLALPSDVLFTSGSAALSREGREAVMEVGAALSGMKDRRFQIEGHTDNVPIRTSRYPSNWELAADRALGVVKALIDSGMVAESLSAAGYGEFHPTATNDSDQGRAQNRRIEIVLVPDLSMLPGFDQLKGIVDK